MKNLITIQNNQAVTTSLQVAEVFNMEHKNVLKAIRNLDCSHEFKRLNFEQHRYKYPMRPNVYNTAPAYYLTKDGFSFLVMGFTGKKAGKFKEDFINAFNKMEEQLKKQGKTQGEIKDQNVTYQSLFYDSCVTQRMMSGLLLDMSKEVELYKTAWKDMEGKYNKLKKSIRQLV